MIAVVWVVWVVLLVGCWGILRVEGFVVFGGGGERERDVGLVRLCFERRRADLESGSQVVLY